MVMGAWKAIAVAIILGLILGCAAPSKQLAGKEKLEAKDWLHAGDLAYKIQDYDTAQYYYEMVTIKYPDTYYGKKAKENLGYVNFQKGIAGKAIQKGKDAIEPAAIY